MSYIRWPIYVWQSEESAHLWVPADQPQGCTAQPPSDEWAGRIHLPNDLFDDIVLCHFATYILAAFVAGASGGGH